MSDPEPRHNQARHQGHVIISTVPSTRFALKSDSTSAISVPPMHSGWTSCWQGDQRFRPLAAGRGGRLIRRRCSRAGLRRGPVPGERPRLAGRSHCGRRSADPARPDRAGPNRDLSQSRQDARMKMPPAALPFAAWRLCVILCLRQCLQRLGAHRVAEAGDTAQQRLPCRSEAIVGRLEHVMLALHQVVACVQPLCTRNGLPPDGVFSIHTLGALSSRERCQSRPIVAVRDPGYHVVRMAIGTTFHDL